MDDVGLNIARSQPARARTRRGQPHRRRRFA
jgi:hypothetical protein